MPAVLFLTGLENCHAQRQHITSSRRRETRGREGEEKEGEGRDRGKGGRPVNNPPRPSGKSYTHRLHACVTEIEMEEHGFEAEWT